MATDPIGQVPAHFDERYVGVADGVELRVLEWRPAGGESRPPLVFVAGWISVLDGWAPLLRVLVGQRRVVYVESREKRSARIPRRCLTVASFSIPRLAEDLIELWPRLDVDPAHGALFGSSMGSNAILEALKGQRLAAHAAFLVGPNSSFRYPWWAPALIHLPACSYHLAKHVLLWYLRHFRVNTAEDPAQMRRYERTVNAAEPVRLKLSARAVVGYEVWPGIDTITAPVAIAFAPSDTLHGADDVQRIAGRLPAGRTIACPSNTYMHSADVARELDEFLDTV